MLEGPCAESEEKHEPASDADAAVVDSLKALDLNRPIREADINDWPHRSLAEGNYDGLKSRRNRDVGWFHRCTSMW